MILDIARLLLLKQSTRRAALSMHLSRTYEFSSGTTAGSPVPVSALALSTALSISRVKSYFCIQKQPFTHEIKAPLGHIIMSHIHTLEVSSFNNNNCLSQIVFIEPWRARKDGPTVYTFRVIYRT